MARARAPGGKSMHALVFFSSFATCHRHPLSMPLPLHACFVKSIDSGFECRHLHNVHSFARSLARQHPLTGSYFIKWHSSFMTALLNLISIENSSGRLKMSRSHNYLQMAKAKCSFCNSARHQQPTHSLSLTQNSHSNDDRWMEAAERLHGCTSDNTFEWIAFWQNDYC